MNTTQRVAFLGLGAMGRGMAERLAAAGHRVTTWNRTPVDPPAGTTWSTDAGNAVADAEVVVVMVADDAASRAVWSSIAGQLPAGVLAIECSTVSPDHTQTVARELPAHVRFIEAPVIGSQPQLAAGQLVSLVAGPAEHVDAARPVLSSWSTRIEHLGAIGNAAIMKLMVNAAFAIQVAAYAEIVATLERSPLDTVAATELLASLPITSPAMQRTIAAISARSFAPNFPIRLVAKDLRYATSSRLAGDDDRVPMTAAARHTFTAAVDEGLGGDDIVGIAQRYL